jgi:anti-sigma factor RsiW
MSQTDSVSLVTDHELQAFVDGELDGRRYRRIVAHLANDSVAAERVNGFLRQQGELALLREQLADFDPLSDPITADLTLQLAGSVRHQRRVRMGMLGAGLMASALVGLVTWWGPNPGEMAQRLSWSRQVAESGPQMLFGRDPFNGVAQLAASETGDAPLKLDQELAAYSIRRPDLAAHGLRFVGGDALKGGEAPAIRLVYADDAQRRVFLFVGAVGSGADVALTVVPEGHVSLNWRRGNLVFALIGPKDSDQLIDVMAATSEMLAPLPGQKGSDTTVVAAPNVVAGDTPGAGVSQAPTVASVPDLTVKGSVVGKPSSNALPVTPAVAEETVSKPL